jgi:uncharacterized membrane protein
MARKEAPVPAAVNDIIGNLLRVGVIAAAAVVLAGGAIYLARTWWVEPEYRLFHGEPADLETLSGILKDAAAFKGRGIIQLGLLVLIMTPVARVALSVIAFMVERDYMYAAVTAFVLAVLVYSLSGGGL